MKKSLKPIYNTKLLLVIYSTFFEYFLFSTFIVYSKVIARDLFPHTNSQYRFTEILIIFFIASVSRPIGGILFSNIGDSAHRGLIFFYTTIIMSISSIFIAVMPNLMFLGSNSIIIMLLIIRVVQGLAVGAEIPEGIIFCYEMASPSNRVKLTNLTSLALVAGLMTAIICSILTNKFYIGAGWQLNLFVFGIVGLIVATALRGSFGKSERQQEPPNYRAIKEVLANYKMVILRLVGFAAFLTSVIAVFIYVMPWYLREYLHFSDKVAYISTIFVGGGFALGLACAIFIHEKISRNLYLSGGVFLKLILILVFHSYIRHNIIEITILNSICLFLFGFFTAKLPALIASSFPQHIRYSGVALVYNLSFGVMYAITQVLINWFITRTGSLYMPYLYIMFFSYVSLVSLWFMSKELFIKYND